MNELNKNNIAQETHAKAIGYYKQSEQFGYKFLMELKKIRDDRLFNELGFNDFEQYTIENFGYSKRSINESIQSALSWGEDYKRISARFGKYKTLQLAQLPEDERNEVLKSGVETSEGNKSVDDATVKEIKELNRKLKQSEEANKTLDGLLSEKADTISALEQQVKNKPKPEVVEKTVTKEVTPSDYDELKREASITSDLRQRNSQTQQEMDDIKSQLEKAKADAEFYQKELSAAERIKKNNQKLDDWERDKQRELSVLKVQTAISIYSLIHDIQDFLKKENIVRDVSQAKDLDDESKRDLQEANEGLQRFVDKVNQILDGRKIIEGEFSE